MQQIIEGAKVPDTAAIEKRVNELREWTRNYEEDEFLFVFIR